MGRGGEGGCSASVLQNAACLLGYPLPTLMKKNLRHMQFFLARLYPIYIVFLILIFICKNVAPPQRDLTSHFEKGDFEWVAKRNAQRVNPLSNSYILFSQVKSSAVCQTPRDTVPFHGTGSPGCLLHQVLNVLSDLGISAPPPRSHLQAKFRRPLFGPARVLDPAHY